MLVTIESYNAQYPAAYYEVGTVYSFYGHKNGMAKQASHEQIRDFAPVLQELSTQQPENAIQPIQENGSGVFRMRGVERYYGVVVDTTVDAIEVMYQQKEKDGVAYFTKQYVVDSACATDGMEWWEPVIMTVPRTIRTATRRMGGITRHKNNKESRLISGITRHKNREHNTN